VVSINSAESCKESSAMEVRAANASAKLRQPNRIELTIQFTLVARHFHSKNNWLGEIC